MLSVYSGLKQRSLHTSLIYRHLTTTSHTNSLSPPKLASLNGTLWHWGGSSSMFGTSSTSSSTFAKFPVKVEGFSGVPIDSIAAGTTHSAFVVGGRVYTFGCNQYGQLGRKPSGKKDASLGPDLADISSSYKIVGVSCGDCHTVAVTEEGLVLVWGWSGSFWSGAGGLGLGFKGQLVDKPTIVESLSKHRVVQAACGAQHTLVLTDQHQVFATGKGEFGRLGRGHNGDQTKHEEVEYLTRPENMMGTEIIKIDCGVSHSAALGSDGAVWVWGRNDHGQLGLEDNMGDMYSNEMYPRRVKTLDMERIQIRDMCCADYHMTALSVKGVIYFWGGRAWLSPRAVTMDPAYKNNPVKGQITKIQAGGFHSYFNFAIADDGHLYSWGKPASGCLIREVHSDANEPAKVDQSVFDNEAVVDIECGRYRVLAVTTPRATVA